MKTRILIFVLFLFIAKLVSAQIVVALHSPTNGTQFFSDNNPFQSAYNAAVDNDTIYLPGGSLFPPAKLEKKLVIYGVGHYDTATAATRKTIINGNIVINHNANGLHLEGVQFGNLTFDYNDSVQNVLIKRCKMNSISINGNMTTPAESIVFIENVTGGMDLRNLKNSIFYNNIICGQINKAVNLTFLNNIFLYEYYHYNVVNYAFNSMFKNNIFKRKDYYSDRICGGSGGSTWEYNIFVHSNPILGTNSTINNNYQVNGDSIFVNQSGNSFNYSHDYHLQTTAASNLGSDNTVVGIYGGYHPWKEFSIPVNPHISSKNISETSNSNGQLHIDITVHAQDR